MSTSYGTVAKLDFSALSRNVQMRGAEERAPECVLMTHEERSDEGNKADGRLATDAMLIL